MEMLSTTRDVVAETGKLMGGPEVTSRAAVDCSRSLSPKCDVAASSHSVTDDNIVDVITTALRVCYLPHWDQFSSIPDDNPQESSSLTITQNSQTAESQQLQKQRRQSSTRVARTQSSVSRIKSTPSCPRGYRQSDVKALSLSSTESHRSPSAATTYITPFTRESRGLRASSPSGSTGTERGTAQQRSSCSAAHSSVATCAMEDDDRPRLQSLDISDADKTSMSLQSVQSPARFVDLLQRTRMRLATDVPSITVVAGLPQMDNSVGCSSNASTSHGTVSKSQLEVPASAPSRDGSATDRSQTSHQSHASFNFFADIRELNEKIVSGKVARRQSPRPGSCNAGRSCAEAHCPPSNERAVSAGVSVDGVKTQAQQSVTNRETDSPNVSNIKLFYSPPLLSLTCQNTEPKFFAGVELPYRLPERLPEKLPLRHRSHHRRAVAGST